MSHNTSIRSVNGSLSAKGFPRQLRLLSSSDFQQVFKHTECRSVDQRLTVLARQNKLQHARLGLAISKRIIKTAVGRNRVKRLVRESFRQHQQLLTGLDIVVMSRNGAVQASNPEILNALQTHWQRVTKKCAKA
jgi:ribonuclease P protein component